MRPPSVRGPWRTDMTIRNLSPATQRSYLSAVSKFSRHFRRSPDRLGLDAVRDFQVPLVAKGGSWGSLNQIVCALRFFYGVTLGEATIPERIPYVRMPRKLPVVLSAGEVVRFLEAVSGLKSRAALTPAYAAGRRASEVAGLPIEDIDSDRGVIRVGPGNGAKDRDVMLSAQLRGILRTYWRLARPRRFLFPGRDEDRSLNPTVLHAAWPLGGEGGGASPAGDAAYAAPQLRDASSGKRRRHPDHPEPAPGLIGGAARARQPVLDGALHPCCFAYDPGDAEPVRPPVGGGDAAGIGAWPVPGAGPRGRRWRSPTFYTVMAPPTSAPMRAVLAVSRSG